MKKSHPHPLVVISLLSLIVTCLLLPGAIRAEDADSAKPPEKASAEAEELQEMQKQFDFWLGEWNLTWKDGGKGTNTITKILEDQVIKESFNGKPSIHLVGQSYTVFVKPLKIWKQTWVDNESGYLDFTGGLEEDGRMILSREAGKEGKKFLQRMVWHNIKENQFDWNWERSDDQGATWKVAWHIHYERK